jgi:hypothetical protein
LKLEGFFFSFEKEMCFCNSTSMAGGKEVLQVPKES